MIGRASFTVTLAVLLIIMTPGDPGAYSRWHFHSSDAYEACIEGPHSLTTGPWSADFPRVDHPALAELNAPAFIRHLFRDDASGTRWQAVFSQGNTTIRADAVAAGPLELSMLDGVLADLGFQNHEATIWDEGNDVLVGTTWIEGVEITHEIVEERAWIEYRVAGHPDLEGLLDAEPSRLHLSDHRGGHSGIFVRVGHWEWYIMVADCLPDNGARMIIGPDGHGTIMASKPMTLGDAFQSIQAAFPAKEISVTELAPPPGMEPS